MKKNTLINILTALISVIIVFCVAEVIMRFAWEGGHWVKRPIYRKSFNPYLRYELIPNSRDGKVRVNSAGMRGQEYPFKKPKDTFRIAMLGDSEIFSIMLDEKETLSVQLEALLNESSGGQPHYEVLNFGIEGYGTLQELEVLEVKALKFAPDLIILNYVLNDPEPGEYYFNKNFFMRHSALVRYFSFRIKKTLIKKERKRLGIANELENYNYYHQPKYFIPTKNAILKMSDISRKIGNKLVVVIFPTSSLAVNDFKENYPYYHIHKLIKTIPSEDIVFIDPIDEFNRLGMTPQVVAINYIYDESHKNGAALKVMANYIYQTLKSNKLIPR